MLEEFSEGEKGDVLSDMSPYGGDGAKGSSRIRRISSVDVMENWAKQQHKEKKLYLVLIRHDLFFYEAYLFIKTCLFSPKACYIFTFMVAFSSLTINTIAASMA